MELTPSTTKRKRTTHGHLQVWFVSQKKKPKATVLKPARAPLTPLHGCGARAKAAWARKAAGFHNNRHNTNGGKWIGGRGRWTGRGFGKRVPPRRPASRRFSERAPSLRLLKPFAPLSHHLCEHGSHLSGDAIVDEGAPMWLDVYGTNDSLFLASPGPSYSRGSPTAVEGSARGSKPASPS
jgi:hypothetical protein